MPKPSGIPAHVLISLRILLLSCVVLLGTLMPRGAVAAEPVDALMQALQIDEILEIMQEEGMAYGDDLAQDMFPGGDRARWTQLLGQIYDIEKMRVVLRQHFVETLGETDMTKVTEFFESDLGRRIVESELSARRALIDDDVEAAARAAFQSADPEEPRMVQLDRFVEAGDLLEANVTGALNASFKFYSGLVDGGGLQMSENDILSDVWSQEADTRADTMEWLYAFLMMAYEPLSDAEMEQYIAASETESGRVLNQALFAGFNAMYDDISYALGLAAAAQMQTQEL